MAPRTVYGRTHGENGWPFVDTGSCTWVKVPGAEHVSLQIQNGQPLHVLRAFAADVHAHVEPLRDADSACWTATNSVASSNHLSGTAMDLNWNGADGRTFRFQIPEDRAWPPPKNRALREVLDFYEDVVFCGGFWSIRDWMHFQMGGNTYNNPRTQDFIARKIRADGFSTFRRGNAPIPAPLSKKDRYALATINEGRRLNITPKGIKIALAVELVESNLTMYANRNVPESLNFPHEKVGSDHDSTGLFQQRQAWGPLAETMDPTLSARLFFLGGHAGQRGLTDFDYNSAARTPGGWAQAVQVSAFPDRYDERYAEAERIYDRLQNIEGDDDMANVPQDQWDWVYNELHKQFGDRSMYPDPENPDATDTLAGRVLDARTFAWETRVEDSALRGEQWAIARVVRAAAKPGNEFLSNHAKAVLAEIEAKNPAALQEFVNGAE
jgi:hypothetical protein